MKPLLILVALFWSATAFGMMRMEPIVISVSELQKKGFTITVTEEQGDFPSRDLSVRIPKDTEEERFLFMQLIIVDHEVSQGEVEATDAVGKSVRSTTKEERTSAFTLIGREAKRTYLTLDFKCPADHGIPHQRRYLLAISEVIRKKKEANQTSEPTAPSGRGSP